MTALPTTYPRSFVIIDSRVTDWQRLVDGINPNATILVLDTARDGLTQIAEAVANITNIDSIHIISHGSSGSLLLGSTTLDSSNLSDYQAQLVTIGNALTSTGDILLYGCDVAQSDMGLAFINQLSTLTGADVAASTNLTGAANKGGDWVLEAQTGAIEATSLQINAYSGTFSVSLGVFYATDATHGTELWVTDGTAAGTSLLKDIYTGLSSGFSMPVSLQSFATLENGKAVFNASNGVNGTELWITDGTAVGTNLVKDIYTGLNSSMSYGLTSLGNGKALFGATDATNGTELWITDGTTAGTNLVKDIATGTSASFPNSSFPVGFTSLGNGKAIFSASVAGNIEQWITDGTSAGTVAFKDIFAGTAILPNASNFNVFTSLGNGKAVFSTDDGINGVELWITDGTTAGTSLVKDIYTGTSSSGTGINSSYPNYMTSLGNGKAVFSASDANYGNELWITDGTTAGTILVKDIAAGGFTLPNLFFPNYSFPSFLTSLGNDKIVFTANDSINGNELWVTDGTTIGTYLVKDIAAGATSSNPTIFTSLGYGKATFSATNALGVVEQWITDGTSAGTLLSSTANAIYGYSNPTSYSAMGSGKLLFSATDATNGTELWMTDGTVAGTTLLKDINLATASSNPSPVTMLNNVNGKPVLTTPVTINYIDTAFVDFFASNTGLLKASTVNASATLTYGIINGTNNFDGTISKSNAYGTLTVTMAGVNAGAYSFAPNSVVIESLKANVTDNTLTVTVSDGLLSDSKIFTVAIVQNGVTESNGDDVLTGFTVGSVDTWAALAGNDLYYVDNIGDTIIENVGGGIDTVYSTVSYNLGADVENLVLRQIAGIDLNGMGNALDNNLRGNNFNNILDGSAGADTMTGGLGNDTYYVDNTGDVVTEIANQGLDSVYSTISYTLGANVENLVLRQIAGIDLNGTGNALDNTLRGNNFNNILDGLTGADTMTGGLGNDTYYVDNTGDVVTELAGQGLDTVYSTISYTLGANVENLVLRQIAGIDLNGTGNALDNNLRGNNFNNILDGGAGADTMTGGLGNDTYNLAETIAATDTLRIATGDSLGVANHDRVYDFQRGMSSSSTLGVDRLDLDTTTIAANAAAVNGIDAGNILSHSITDGIISFDDTQSYAAAPMSISSGDLTNVINYLRANITGGNTVAFSDNVLHTYVFQDGGATDTFVELVGNTAALSVNTTGLGLGSVWII